MNVWRTFVVCLLILQGIPACKEHESGPVPAQASPLATAATADACEHGLPPTLCTKCNPSLAAVFKAKGDWCEEHGFPKSFCPTCNPGAKAPTVSAAPAPASDWCTGHGLPESKCTKCNPQLIPQFRAANDWCEEHGFPESACPVCNPQSPPGEAQSATADWCLEHAVPESKCTKCNPSLIPQFRAANDFCDEHGFPESVCPVCNPQKPPAGAERSAIEARVVRFRSPDMERLAGLQTVTASSGKASATVECAARIAFDADKVADVRAITPGIVRRVHATLGAEVTRGALLFELESTRVGEIQGALQAARERARTAQANLTRQQDLREAQIVAARQLELAEQELASARSEVQTAEATLRLTGAAQSTPSGRYTLSAPLAGTVVRRPAVVGLLATDSESLATIADTSIMWALCEVPESRASDVELGQQVTIRVPGKDDRSIDGKVTWLAAEVDPRTRTVAARAEVPNESGLLRANQFVSARIEVGAPREAVTVPRVAVQRVDDLEVVFVRTSAGVYEPRVVKRFGESENVQVEGRVHPGDEVVTTGAVLLKTEIIPGSIGAGCCEVEPPGAKAGE